MKSVLAAMLILAALPSLSFAQEAYGPFVRDVTAPRVFPRNSGANSKLPVPTLEQAPLDPTNINPLTVLAGAADALKGGQSSATPPGGLSSSINILVVLTVISLAPSIMLMTTCFVRIIVVLGLLKQALGTQSLPPPQVILGLALFMTLLVMAPTFDRIHKEAIVPYSNGQIRDYDALWDKSKQPMRDFMFDQIDATGNWSSVYMVLNYRGVDTSRPQDLTTADVDMVSLIPAFMLSELKAGFLIGFKVYLPFLVIDMVISSLLISMGMMMLPPVLISLPFKLLLFVLVDGWQLVVGSLMTSFVTHPVPPDPAAHAAAGMNDLAAPLLQVLNIHAPALGTLLSTA